MDESRIGAHHKDCKILQFNKDKPERWAIEHICICASDKYLYCLSNPRYSKSKGGMTSVESAKLIFEKNELVKNSVITADTHFISFDMLKYLLESGIKYCISVPGTVLQEIYKKSLHVVIKQGRTVAAEFKDYICVTTDSRKKVNIITNIYNVSSTDEVQKENARNPLKFYDVHKRKADQFNFLFTKYLSPHCHNKLEGTLLNGYISIILTNAFLAYCSEEKDPLDHKQFLLSVSKDLLFKYK